MTLNGDDRTTYQVAANGCIKESWDGKLSGRLSFYVVDTNSPSQRLHQNLMTHDSKAIKPTSGS
jgi:hypothetical protein